MILGHQIALEPTDGQASYFRRAAGTARYAYNWGLAEWKRMYKAGEKPNANKVKAAWNAHREAELPWSYEVTKCASAQAIRDLGKAFSNFFRDLEKPKHERHFGYPQFRRKRTDEGFYIDSDKLEIDGRTVKVPMLGQVKMREELRFSGKIMGARVSFSGGRWFLSVQVETVPDVEPAPAGTFCGIDWGIETLATVSSEDGTVIEKVENPKPGKRLAEQKKRLQRRASKQRHRAKALRIKDSRRQYARQLKVSKLAARERNIRQDAAHKFTTGIARRIETVVLEDLNASGMSKNHALAGAVLDANPYEIRRQLEYKVAMRGGRIVYADRFYPSSRTCSACGLVVESLPLSMRTWTCVCGTHHDRDANSAINLERLGRATAEVTRRDMAASTYARKGAGKRRGRTANQNSEEHICAPSR